MKLAPLLDSWASLGGGSFAGRVFDLAGVVDGTAIVTERVDYVNQGIEDGYIITCSGILFELGDFAQVPQSVQQSDIFESKELRGFNTEIQVPSMKFLTTASSVGVAMALLWEIWNHHLAIHMFVV